MLTPAENKRVDAVRDKLLIVSAKRAGVELSGSINSMRTVVSVHRVPIGYIVDDGVGNYSALKYDSTGHKPMIVSVGEVRPSAIQAAFEFEQVKQAIAERAR